MMIRKMKIDDYRDVYQLWLSCHGMGLNHLDDSKEGIEQFLRRNPHTCFVAVEDHQIVGAIMVGQDGRRGYIYHTAVHPNFRHRTIGTLLVKRAIEALKQENIHKVALVVFKKNQEGNRFWEKLGFTVRDDIIYRNKAMSEMIRMDT